MIRCMIDLRHVTWSCDWSCHWMVHFTTQLSPCDMSHVTGDVIIWFASWYRWPHVTWVMWLYGLFHDTGDPMWHGSCVGHVIKWCISFTTEFTPYDWMVYFTELTPCDWMIYCTQSTQCDLGHVTPRDLGWSTSLSLSYLTWVMWPCVMGRFISQHKSWVISIGSGCCRSQTRDCSLMWV